MDLLGTVESGIGAAAAQGVRANENGDRAAVPGDRHFVAILDTRQEVRQGGSRFGYGQCHHDKNCTVTYVSVQLQLLDRTAASATRLCYGYSRRHSQLPPPLQAAGSSQF